MPEYHTIIAGAGPAGLACATILASAGRKVLVLDRNRRVGPKVCAGGITWSGIRNRVPNFLIEKAFCDQHVYTKWQRTIISGREPLISTIDRVRLGQWMLEKARAAGAEVLTSTAVMKLAGNRLTTGRGEFTFHFLVGADGSGSTVRRLLDIPVSEVGVGINFWVEGDFPSMEWHLDADLFRNGYAWIFPHRQAASIGAYACRRTMPPAELLKKFHQWTEKRGINLGRAKMTSALINHDYRGWRFGNCFLVGDAAGLASALTGEGIYPAIVSGEEAARVILDPGHECEAMRKLVARHRLHRRVIDLTAGRKTPCRLVMEGLVLGLRAGLVPFSSLEMAS